MADSTPDTLPEPSPNGPAEPTVPTIQLWPVDDDTGLAHIRLLFTEYQADIGIDLSFQGFEDELQRLPGDYAHPQGLLLLACVDGVPAGCCALRPAPETHYVNACEMKRLFVRRAFRGFGLGRQLVEHTLNHATQAGYACMLLDTLSDMEAARALYQDVGFEEVAPYYHNPLPGAHYLKVALG